MTPKYEIKKIQHEQFLTTEAKDERNPEDK